MSNDVPPRPPSHRTFSFDSVQISSDFDSGNCSNAEKVGSNQFHIWIGTDNPKNNYRTWFHFSVAGVGKGSMVSFKIRNMQNQSRLLNQGLVPVFREEEGSEWKRVSEKVNTGAIEYNQGWIQWTFKHQFKSSQKHYFAFFYPWSNEENAQFLTSLQEKAKQDPQIYFYRGTIAKTLQNRPIQFLAISSTKGKSHKQQQYHDENLFKQFKKPHTFLENKPGIVISARVHPGELPSSHVMTGILKTLLDSTLIAKTLRNQFVFYVLPILNPDGVARGHYRVDTNGINLNRCYINPSPKDQPAIYSIKKIINHLHSQNRFFAFLDLHAHAARKGTFIYGNCSNELQKQMKACIFPKLLSMNSIDFEYEGSNFTQKNMYCKDRGDHMSKEGSGRVAMFKSTKNAYCWTMECNYNISRIQNVLQSKKDVSVHTIKSDANQIDQKIVLQYKQPLQNQAKQFFTIATYHKLGREVCQTFLDLIGKNPESRIDNPKNHFKNVNNVKMNLAVALLRMAPNRFEPTFKKIYSGFNSENAQIVKNSVKALYHLLIDNAKVQNIGNFIKSGQMTEIIFPQVKKQNKRPAKAQSFRSRQSRYNAVRSFNNIYFAQNYQNVENFEQKIDSPKLISVYAQEQNNNLNFNPNQDSESDQQKPNCLQNMQTSAQVESMALTRAVQIQKQQSMNRITMKLQEYKMIKMFSKKVSVGRELAQSCVQQQVAPRSQQAKIYSKVKIHELPFLGIQKSRQQQRKMQGLRKGPSLKEQYLFIA